MSETHLLRLFVAGDEPNSRRARENLAQICNEHLDGIHEVEVVDILEDFQAALENNVLVTPTLIMVAPEPRVTILGSLSDKSKVISALRLTPGEP